MVTRIGSWLLLAAALAACTDPMPSDLHQDRVQYKTIENPGVKQLDLLFIIDRSPAMAKHASALASSMPAMMQTLVTLQGGLPWIHVAVTTADGDGTLRTSAAVHGAFIDDAPNLDGSRERNYDGDLAETFAELANVGFDGPDVTTPLAIAPRAVTRDPAFLREHAQLLIAIITDRDDASSASVAEYVSQLRALQADPNQLTVGFAAPLESPRLQAMAAELPNRATFQSIDDQDFTGVLEQTSEFPEVRIADPCWEAPILGDECSVESSELGVLPRCPDGLNCWSTAVDATRCAGGDHQLLQLVLPGSNFREPSTVAAQCVSRGSL